MRTSAKQILIGAGIVIFLFPFFFQGLMSAAPERAHAFLISRFGGIVTTQIWCSCSKGSVIFVGPPMPKTVYVGAKSRVYANYNYTPGHWVLGLDTGTYTGGCWKKAGKSCAPIPYQGEVIIMGTS